jgi:DNA processing protein
MDERTAWIVLASVDFVGEETFGRLIADFGSAREVLARAHGPALARWSAAVRSEEGRAPLTTLALSGIEAAARDPDERLAPIRAHGLWTATPLDSDFPKRLLDLDPVPALIHGLGDKDALHAQRSVAVVGTRRPTPAGRLLATRVVGRLVEASATVVSGVAVGIDGVAHHATLERSGVTVGVIGGGHCHPGVRAHHELRARIVAERGALISEHHPDIRPKKGTFPRRNRIIAALADATLVIEAPVRSGALITARRAGDMNREVFAAPGRIEDWAARGALALLREGVARPLVGLDEMIEDLGFYRPADADETVPATPGQTRTAALAMLGPAERAVAERIATSPCGLDLLVAHTGLPPATVSSAVTLLQLRGWLTQIGPAYLPAGPLVE